MRCDSYASGNLLLYSRRISVAVNRCRHISWRVCDDGFFYGSLGFMFIIHRVSARPICCRGGWLCFDPVPDRVQILVASGSGFKETRWHHCESFIHIYDPDWDVKEGHLLSLYDRTWKTKVHIHNFTHFDYKPSVWKCVSSVYMQLSEESQRTHWLQVSSS